MTRFFRLLLAVCCLLTAIPVVAGWTPADRPHPTRTPAPRRPSVRPTPKPTPKPTARQTRRATRPAATPTPAPRRAAKPTVAAPSEDRRATEKRLADLRSQIRRTETRLKTSQSTASATLATLTELGRRQTLVEELVRTLQTESRHIEADILSKERALDSAETQLKLVQQQYARYATGVYKSGRQTDLERVLTAQSLNQSYVRVEYLRRFTSERRAKLTEVNEQRATVAAERAALAERLGARRQVLDEKQREEAGLAAKQTERQTALAAVRSDQTRYQSELTAQQQQAAQLTNLIDELEAREEAARVRRRKQARLAAVEAARKRAVAEAAEKARQVEIVRRAAALDRQRQQAAAQARQQTDPQTADAGRPQPASGATAPISAAADPVAEGPVGPLAEPPEPVAEPVAEGPTRVEMTAAADLPADYESVDAASFTGNRGRLPWPVTSGVVTAKFGLNTDPVLGTAHPNNGLDLSVADGSVVRAVSPGEVLMVTFIAGYRSVVIVSHGDGYKTVYASLDQVLVKEGARLKAGDPVGRADDAVHFEVWKRRAAQNPETWLRRR